MWAITARPPSFQAGGHAMLWKPGPTSYLTGLRSKHDDTKRRPPGAPVSYTHLTLPTICSV
eukprot:8148369-Alexandrium_andersonii.AAC.1